MSMFEMRLTDHPGICLPPRQEAPSSVARRQCPPPPRRWARAALMALQIASAGALAGPDMIFEDQFEAAAGVPACVAGNLGGRTLPTPPLAGAELIGCFELRNDGPPRRAELATGSLPVARGLALADDEIDRLVVIGPGGARWPAQYAVLSRWARPLADTAAPVRWLHAALSVDQGAGQNATLALLRLPQAPAGLPAIEIVSSDERRTVDTGWIEVKLDGSFSQPLRRLRVREQLGGPLLDVFQANPGSADEGWRIEIVDVAGAPLLFAGEQQPGSMVVDRVRWESGAATVVSVLHLDGHVEGPAALTLCGGDPDWPRFSWSLSLRLVADSADLQFDWQFGNACGVPQAAPASDAIHIGSIEFRLPLLRGTAAPTPLIATDGPVQQGNAPGQSHRLWQRRGSGTPWQRRAELQVGGALVASAEYYDEPGLGLARSLGSGQLIALAAQPWLRYREPQGLTLGGSHLGFQLVSERILVGKAKSLWFSGRVAIETGVQAAELDARAEALHRRNLAALEQPLLLRPLPASLDAAAILPPLTGSIAGPAGNAYRLYLQRKQDDTTGDEPCLDAGNDIGSQWTCAKTFGLQLWPDVQFNLQFGFEDLPDPASNEGKLNYWDPAHIELVEFLRSGEPRWAHGFALPQARLMAYSAYYNFGGRRGSNIAGHSFGSGGNGDGLWHRGDSGSADYSYNRHQALAYLLQPGPAQRDRFAAAGHAAGLRFVDDPGDDTSWSAIGRLNLQYIESLANCAQFVPATEGVACDSRLREVLGKLIDSSLSAGLMCERKFAPGPDCFVGQFFMLQAWYYPILDRLFLNWGESFPLAQRERWRNALVQTPLRVLAELPRSGAQVDVAALWPNGLQCQLGGADFSIVQGCMVIPDPDNLRQNKPAFVSLLVRGHAFDPGRGLCAAARQISNALHAGVDPLGNLRDVARGGWWKGAAEAGQELSTAALGVEQCIP
jgi:hypothetical protein